MEVVVTKDKSHALASSNLVLTNSWSKVPFTPASLDFRLDSNPATNWYASTERPMSSVSCVLVGLGGTPDRIDAVHLGHTHQLSRCSVSDCEKGYSAQVGFVQV